MRAPNAPGAYMLVAEFTYRIDGADVKVTRAIPVNIVAPIVLSVTLHNSGGEIAEMNVRFVVNGNPIEGSERPVTLRPGETKTETYNWVTGGLAPGKYTITVEGEVGLVEGPIHASVSEFFVGQTSYTMIEAIVVVILIVLLIILVIIYRKPVKNLGKPKSRR